MLTGRLKILCAQVAARVAAGETIETVLGGYRLLSEEEKTIIKDELQLTATKE